jgi:hypothetical protein
MAALTHAMPAVFSLAMVGMSDMAIMRSAIFGEVHSRSYRSLYHLAREALRVPLFGLFGSGLL